nr:MAG TPA: hypothetical protein [Caudoviricetes sp.]
MDVSHYYYIFKTHSHISRLISPLRGHGISATHSTFQLYYFKMSKSTVQ